MIEETIGKIEERIRRADSISEEKRKELLGLFSTLKGEVREISQTHGEVARAIAGHTERSASAATEGELGKPALDESLEGLSSSVTGFEESHPKLVEVVNRICVTLSGLGI